MGLILTEQLKSIGKLLQKELVDELVRQGHVNTGELAGSIDFKIDITNEGAEIFAGSNLDYAEWVNNGRKAGGKKVPIAVLIQWVEDKGLSTNDDEIKSIAYAIRQTIYKEGIPSPNSFKFSETGSRTKFVETVAGEQYYTVVKMVEDFAIGQVQKSIKSMVTNFNKNNA